MIGSQEQHWSRPSSCLCLEAKRIAGHVIYPDLSLNWTRFFLGKHLIKNLAKKVLYFWNFVLHNCILISDAEQVYFKPQVTNFKMKEATQ